MTLTGCPPKQPESLSNLGAAGSRLYGHRSLEDAEPFGQNLSLAPSILQQQLDANEAFRYGVDHRTSHNQSRRETRRCPD